MPYNGSFDANQHQPKQGIGSHPIGKFPATISGTSCEPTKDQSGGMFIVEFTTPAGQIMTRYNLWNQSPKAVEIAHGQLSALCHATGIFKLDFNNDGAALRNARCMIEVSYQKGEEPTAEKPQGGYVEVKKVYDAAGNEPGKAPVGAPQPQGAPMQQQPNGGWAAPQQPAQPQQPANPAPGGWAPQQGPAPQANTNPGWQQNASPSNPPWATGR